LDASSLLPSPLFFTHPTSLLSSPLFSFLPPHLYPSSPFSSFLHFPEFSRYIEKSENSKVIHLDASRQNEKILGDLFEMCSQHTTFAKQVYIFQNHFLNARVFFFAFFFCASPGDLCFDPK
jgi:hypothetical protein